MILRDEKLNKFIERFFKRWEKDIFSIILIPKRKKVVCIVNGFKEYVFDKRDVVEVLK